MSTKSAAASISMSVFASALVAAGVATPIGWTAGRSAYLNERAKEAEAQRAAMSEATRQIAEIEREAAKERKAAEAKTTEHFSRKAVDAKRQSNASAALQALVALEGRRPLSREEEEIWSWAAASDPVLGDLYQKMRTDRNR